MNPFFDKLRADILGLAERGRWGDTLDRVSEQPDVATIRFDFDKTLLIDLAHFPDSSPILLRLLELGADVRHRDETGLSAAEQTLWGGTRHAQTLNELRLLLDRGADPNGLGSTGSPLLHLAIERHRLEHARLLLERGADPMGKSSDVRPETAIDVARRTGNRAALALLSEFKKPQ